MIYKNGIPIQESVSRYPVSTSSAVSITASSSDSVTIDAPEGEIWYIKSFTITKGSNVTVDSIEFDGNDIGLTDSLSDLEVEYGNLLSIEKYITVAGTNAGVSPESLEIEIKGYRMR